MTERHFAVTTYLIHPTKKITLFIWHKKLNAWVPPGGHLEQNETPLEGALREIHEEIGNVNPTFIHPVSTIKLNDDRVKVLKKPHFIIEEIIGGSHPNHMDMIFYAKINDVNLEASPEGLNLKWFDLDNLRKNKNIFDNVQKLAEYGINQIITQ